MKGVSYTPGVDPDTVPFEELKAWLTAGEIIRHAFRYRSVTLVTERLETLTKPLATALLLRVLTLRQCEVRDNAGRSMHIGLRSLLALTANFLRDRRDWPRAHAKAKRDLSGLTSRAEAKSAPAHLGPGRPIYVRSDLIFGVAAGGSVGHIAGVLNNMHSLGMDPIFVTTDLIPTVSVRVETHVVRPESRFRDIPDAPLLAFNDRLTQELAQEATGADISFVYQRYSAYNYAGVTLSANLQVPLVIEFNGSEVWVARNWGRPLKFESTARRVEQLNLEFADLVVVVSDPLRQNLIKAGIRPSKVLVNPNGVDPDRYSPEVDGAEVRAQMGIDEEIVFGFIGTFGKWHGAENLALAFNHLLASRRDLRDRVRLLMIGDGIGLSETRSIIDSGPYGDRAVFTGRVPQADGPSYLAACDILVSPHVPNPDGTRFFGSPTKLFEYMAMGKPIVASELDQIADILDHERTAIMVDPGSVDSLVSGMARAIDEPELAERIATEARIVAVEQHSWREHTRRIVDRLEQICG